MQKPYKLQPMLHGHRYANTTRHDTLTHNKI